MSNIFALVPSDVPEDFRHDWLSLPKKEPHEFDGGLVAHPEHGEYIDLSAFKAACKAAGKLPTWAMVAIGTRFEFDADYVISDHLDDEEVETLPPEAVNELQEVLNEWRNKWVSEDTQMMTPSYVLMLNKKWWDT